MHFQNCWHLFSDLVQWLCSLGLWCSERAEGLYCFQNKPLEIELERVSVVEMTRCPPEICASCQWWGLAAAVAAPPPLWQLLETPGSCCQWSPGGSRCHFLGEVVRKQVCFTQSFLPALSTGCGQSRGESEDPGPLNRHVKSSPPIGNTDHFVIQK